MKVKLKEYRKAHEEHIHKLYRADGINGISFYCSVSYCPIIAAYCFCKEIDPDNKKLTERIELIKVYYGITEVI